MLFRSTGNIGFSVIRQSHGGLGSVFILTLDTSASNGDGLVLTDNTAVSNIVNNDDFHYVVRAYSTNWSGNSDMRISSVKIQYTVPGPK